MARLYHLIHLANLASILKSGALLADRMARPAVSIADSNIKAHRLVKPVSCHPGGCVADYVPFYFAPRSPMLYRLHSGGVTGFDGDQRSLAFLVFELERLEKFGIPLVVTNGNAAAASAKFTNDIGRIREFVDWDVMASERWHNTPEDPTRKHRRQAELLAHGRVPLGLLDLIAVRDEESRSSVEEVVGRTGATFVVEARPDWFY